jgi:hypothetical protein
MAWTFVGPYATLNVPSSGPSSTASVLASATAGLGTAVGTSTLLVNMGICTQPSTSPLIVPPANYVPTYERYGPSTPTHHMGATAVVTIPKGQPVHVGLCVYTSALLETNSQVQGYAVVLPSAAAARLMRENHGRVTAEQAAELVQTLYNKWGLHVRQEARPVNNTQQDGMTGRVGRFLWKKTELS